LPLAVTIEADPEGQGVWQPVATVEVPPQRYAYHILTAGDLKAPWLRLRTAQAATGLSAVFRLGNPARPADPVRFAALADIGDKGPVINGIVKGADGDARKLLFAASRTDENGTVTAKSFQIMDGRLIFTPQQDAAREAILRTKFGVGDDPGFTVDAASVVITTDAGKRYRLPKSSAAYDQPFASGWPRGLREVVTERSLLNAHGTFYEVPRGDAGGFQRMRPICTHNKRISDFASWRGLLVLAGVRADATADDHLYRSSDGQAAVWLGEVDDLWALGTPVGVGGPWKDTAVKAGQASDPYLMAGYRTKSVALSHTGADPVTFTIEVDIDGNGHWCPYTTLAVPAGQTITHGFPAGYSAHWVRLVADRETTASAVFTYTP
jgi:hypothetical protein